MLDKKIKAVVALGYFDSVHEGHRAIIESAKEYAERKNATPVIVTFDGNLKAELKGEGIKVVYTTEERKEIYNSLGINEIYFAKVNKEFLFLSKTEFLDLINARYEVLAYFCGKDYRFGKGGEGQAKDVLEYAKARSQECFVYDIIERDGEKISTTLIKELLSNGEVERANSLLGRQYSISGIVFRDREVGRKIGFPTVNIKLESEKQRLKDGVYFGSVNIDGTKFKALINYGARPTYNLREKLVEAHIVGFNGELYGRKLTLKFNSFYRDIVKFNSENELVNQLEKDLEVIKGKNND